MIRQIVTTAALVIALLVGNLNAVYARSYSPSLAATDHNTQTNTPVTDKGCHHSSNHAESTSITKHDNIPGSMAEKHDNSDSTLPCADHKTDSDMRCKSCDLNECGNKCGCTSVSAAFEAPFDPAKSWTAFKAFDLLTPFTITTSLQGIYRPPRS